MSRSSLAWVSILTAGCVGTQVGNPPFMPEDPNAPTGVPVADLGAESLARGLTTIIIPAGAIPESSTLQLTPVDRSFPSARVDAPEVEETRVSLTSLPGSELRLQVVAPERLAPVDVRIPASPDPAGSPLEPAPRRACLRFESRDVALEPSASPTAEVRMRNDCDARLDLALRFRLDLFNAEPSSLSLAPGEIGALLVTEVEDSPADGEDLLLLEANDDRWAVTVRPAD